MRNRRKPIRKINYRRRNSDDGLAMKLLTFGIVTFAILFWVGGLFNYNRGGKPNYTEEHGNTYYEKQLQEFLQNENVLITDRINYDFSKLSCPKDIFMIADTIANIEGLPTFIWYVVAGMESQFNPKTRSVSDINDNRGLFGIDVKGVDNLDKLKIYQPVYNSELAIPKLKEVYDVGVSLELTGLDLAIYIAKQYIELQLEEGREEQYESMGLYVKSTITKYYHELQLAEIWE